jgi:peroxiredoxin Q/BCP
MSQSVFAHCGFGLAAQTLRRPQGRVGVALPCLLLWAVAWGPDRACSQQPNGDPSAAPAAVPAAATSENPPASQEASEPAAKKPVDLKVGDPAPKFAGKTDKNKRFKSVDWIGKKILVVYFYPADMTPGCTKQACNYRDALRELKRDDVAVIGVSGDTVENHQHFRDAHQLNYTLLADPKGKTATKFGVKMGKGGAFEQVIGGAPVQFQRGVTASRWTFVIGLDGKIAYINRNVNAAADTAEVLKVIAGLSGGKPPAG